MRHQSCIVVIACWLGGILLAGTVRAQPAEPAVAQLSLAKAVELALSGSPASRQASARTAAAEARLRVAKALANPMLSVAHWAGRDTGGLDEDLLLTQTFELGGKRAAAVGQARAEREAAFAGGAGAAVDTVFAVKSAYYEALRADDDFHLAQSALEVAHTFADAARTQYAAGDVARSNVLRSEIEQARAEQDLTTAQTERANRYAALRNLVGLPETGTLELTDKLSFSPVAYDLPRLQAAAANRPDLRAGRASLESLRAAVRSAKAQAFPDMVVEGRRGSIEPDVEGSSVRAGLTFPLFDLGRNRAEVAAARAGVAEQQAKLDEDTRAARLEVETAFNGLAQARKLVESFQGGRLERAKELLDMAQTGYAQGASSYLELLDAQRVYRSEQSDYARALAAHDIAVAALERAVGGQLK